MNELVGIFCYVYLGKENWEVEKWIDLFELVVISLVFVYMIYFS